MKSVVLVFLFAIALAVLQDTAEAQDLYMVPSSCKMNVRGCPKPRADRHCNRCCRKAGCNRGDCHHYNCKCKGCPRG